ncbi:MAG TPA: glycosyltransferase [Steroidobacteraceae bacterium]|nr:glycosyltransferase [Steroidobacteraceae bacterium]
MRILYHHRTQGRGAEGNHIVSIVTALRALGHQVDVLSPPGVDPFDPASTIPVDKARTQTRGWGSLWKLMSRKLPNWLFEIAELVYNVPAYFRLRRALARGNYDLLFERYAFYLVAGAVAAKHAGVPFLLEVNEVNGIPNRARRQSFVKLCGAAERFIFRRCTVVHAVSSWLGEQAVGAGLDRSRLVVVPNGFEIARLKLGRSRDDMRRQLGLDGGIVIGFAGWFDHWDRLDLLVDLFEELRREHATLRLCLVGAGPAAEELHARVAKSPFAGDIVLTGAVPRQQVYDYIQVFDIGVLPHSNVFGSPIVMFEMMGLSIPLVLPRLPPIEDVHRDGETALTFPPLDFPACRAAIARYLADRTLRELLAARARDLLISRHTWRDTAARILASLPPPAPSLARPLA